MDVKVPESLLETKLATKPLYHQHTDHGPMNQYTKNIEGGLLSGWKFTSLMGTQYNLAVADTCQQLTNKILWMPKTNDFWAQGDDTHYSSPNLLDGCLHMAVC